MRRHGWPRAGDARPTKDSMKQALIGLLMAASMSGSAAAQSIVVDDFATGPVQVILDTAPGTESQFVDGAGIVQGERNVRVSGSSVAGGDITAEVANGVLTFDRPSGSTGTIEMWWDGNNDSTSFAPTGLGGIDLTANGQNAFLLETTASSSVSLFLNLYVWTDGSNSSVISLAFLNSATRITIPYTSFVAAAGSGADFSNVGAIFLGTGEGADQPWSLSINDLRTVNMNSIFEDGFEIGGTGHWSATQPP